MYGENRDKDLKRKRVIKERGGKRITNETLTMSRWPARGQYQSG